MLNSEKEFPGYHKTEKVLLDLVNFLKWMDEHPYDGPGDRMVLEDGTEIIL